MAATTAVDRYRTWYGGTVIAAGIPELYGLTPRTLVYWKMKGWLGMRMRGSGIPLPWTAPEVADQIQWLRRLSDSGRQLDDEDAAGGFRLRKVGAVYGIRIGGGEWQPSDVPAGSLTDPYTLAIVTFDNGGK